MIISDTTDAHDMLSSAYICCAQYFGRDKVDGSRCDFIDQLEAFAVPIKTC